MKKFFKEFRDFISKGDVLSMAVGIIIGAAFTAIVTALTTNILNPILNTIIGGISFDNMKVDIKLPWVKSMVESGKLEAYPTINFGAFLSAVITFLVTAFTLFLIIKGFNSAKKLTEKKQEEEATAAPTTKICPHCMSEIHIDATRCPHCTSELEDKAE